jgi:DNA primase
MRSAIMAQPIDFKYLKQAADFLVVLRHYGLDSTGKGVSRALRCPFHPDKTASLKVNLGRKGFHCFGCGAKGNILSFVQKMESLDEDELRAAARKLADIAGVPLAPPSDVAGKAVKRHADAGGGPETMNEPSEVQTPVSEASSASDEASQNEPLSVEFLERFRAKLEPAHEHPYLRARGLTPVLIDTFELGFFPPEAKGMMRGRIVLPIHNLANEIVAFVGCWASDDPLPEGAGKYLLPPKFHKQLELYNLHRVLGKKHLIVVEGYFSVMRLFELGVPAVALMGSTLSDGQVALLHETGVKYLTIMLDGDEAGRSAAPAMMERLAVEPFLVKFGLLPEGTQPDTVPEAFLRELLRLKA